jgi:hypothetical protein
VSAMERTPVVTDLSSQVSLNVKPEDHGISL